MLTGLLQPSHLIVLLVVLLVVLGPKRLPEAGRAVGRGLREFKNSIAGDDDPGTQGTGEARHEQAATLAGSTESESTPAPAEKA